MLGYDGPIEYVLRHQAYGASSFTTKVSKTQPFLRSMAWSSGTRRASVVAMAMGWRSQKPSSFHIPALIAPSPVNLGFELNEGATRNAPELG